MRILLRLLAALVLVSGLAACGETIATGTGSGTQFNPVTGQPVQTEQRVDVRIKRTGIGAPGADSVLGNMLGGNAGGSSSFGSVGYYGPAEVFPAGTILVQGPGPGCRTIARRPSGQENCVGAGGYSGASPWSLGGGYYGTGQYYTTMQNGKWVQKQDIQPGFKVN